LLLPGGKTALSWSDDDSLRVWDLESGAEKQKLTGHTDYVNGALLLPDGKTALSWSDDSSLRVWDLASGAACVLMGYGVSLVLPGCQWPRQQPTPPVPVAAALLNAGAGGTSADGGGGRGASPPLETDISSFLGRLGLSKYTEMFEENEVDMQVREGSRLRRCP
jgi:hypothetical protein